MSKLKGIILTFIVLSLTGCQLASANYFTSTEKGNFIGIAVNYQRLGTNEEDGKTFVAYVYDNENKLDVAKESHLISAEVIIEDDKTTRNVEVNFYPNASKDNHTFSLSAIYERGGEIVYETISPISLINAGEKGSIAYYQENESLDLRENLNIKVNLESKFIDENLTLHEFDSDHQLKSSTVLESLKDINPKHEYFIVESERTDGSLHRQLSTDEISTFKEGDELLIYEFIMLE